MNTRFNLDPKLVVDQICDKCNAYTHQLHKDISCTVDKLAEYTLHPELFDRQPRSIDELYTAYNRMSTCELTYYSTVRVIHIPDAGYYLVYGNIVDNEVKVGDGTGNFISVEAASDWFFNGGR